MLRLVGVGVAGVALAPGLTSAAAKSGHGKNKGKGKGKAQSTNPLSQIPVRGVGPDGKSAFKGFLEVQQFAANTANNGIVASGVLTGTVKGGDQGNGWHDIGSVPVTDIPVSFGAGGASAARARNSVSAAATTCQILDLTLGPLDLNLLGLRIQLNQVHLQITAQQGGGLLGDLLCGVANLLNGGLFGQLANLLNQILGILQGL